MTKRKSTSTTTTTHLTCYLKPNRTPFISKEAQLSMKRPLATTPTPTIRSGTSSGSRRRATETWTAPAPYQRLVLQTHRALSLLSGPRMSLWLGLHLALKTLQVLSLQSEPNKSLWLETRLVLQALQVLSLQSEPKKSLCLGPHLHLLLKLCPYGPGRARYLSSSGTEAPVRTNDGNRHVLPSRRSAS
jgi:hypothetical protein